MRRLRLYDPDNYCEVTIRAQGGEFAFDLNDTVLRERIYGILAEAARRTGVAIFVFHFLSNHYHGLYGYTSPHQLVAFLAQVHGQLARLANARAGRTGTFWSKPKICAVSRDAASVAARYRYILGQAVRANLCAHPGEFPGASAVDALLYGAKLVGRRVDGTRRCRDAARLVGGAKADEAYETLVELPLAVPECWAELSAEALRGVYWGIVAEIAPDTAAGGPSPPVPVPVGSDQTSPGTCLIHENTDDSVESMASARPVGALPGAELTPPAKVRVPDRSADDGGRYRHGDVRPKSSTGRRQRGSFPGLLSVCAQRVADHALRYKQAVQSYRAAKLAWRGTSRRTRGALHAAAITLPAWMLLGTLPLAVAHEARAVRAPRA